VSAPLFEYSIYFTYFHFPVNGFAELLGTSGPVVEPLLQAAMDRTPKRGKKLKIRLFMAFSLKGQVYSSTPSSAG